MARKDLLKGLMNAPPAPQDEGDKRVDTARPRYTAGAIGAVSQSIAQLKARSVMEIDPRIIDPAGIHDRLDSDGDDDQGALMRSIEVHGQQVPVLLRPNPNDPERFQVVYGRRRVAALKSLGQPVKAIVRVLNDEELIVAQGQENNARKELSFIERANFARQMRDAGYDRTVICDALHVDKTVISRMLSVADRVPVELIEAVGAAPTVGRDRWLALADLIEARGQTPLPDPARLREGAENSDARFANLLASLNKRGARHSAEAPRKTTIKGADGSRIATVAQSGKRTVLTLDPADGFSDWLRTHLTQIHRDWKNQRGE